MPKLAEISFQSVSITLNYMNNNVMFQFISVCLRYLVHVLVVRSAMNQYRFFYIVLVFWNILVLVLVLVNK